MTEEEMEEMHRREKEEARQAYHEREAEKNQRIADNSLDPDNKKTYAHRAVQHRKKAVQIAEKPVANSGESGIIISGARITDPFSKEAEQFAEMYYEEIRHFSTDYKKIANHLGKSEEDVKKVKAYLFEDKSLFDEDINEYRRFDPDCAIAQSWQRLMIGKDIKPHDKTLIEHELYEMRIKADNPSLSHLNAHEIATRKYDYQTEAGEYYGNLKKNKKRK